MLLYITAEDVFGDGAPKRQGPRPLHRIPATLAGLFDLGLRHHIRPAAMMWPTAEGFESVPDWKLDRLAIRVALYGREKAGVEPGERVAIFGRLGWLWPVVDFAAMGFGAVPLGIEHDLPDAALAGALAEARPRIVFASDPASAERLRALRRQGGLGDDVTVVAEGLAAEEHALSLERLLELGGVFDTAERAQSFRAVSRQVEPRGEALRHVGPEGVARLTHGEAMERVEPGLRTRPALAGDVAYVGGPRMSLGTRLTLAAFVGDGLTTTTLGREGRTDEDLVSLRPHKMIISGEWLEAACREQGPRWPGGLDRPWARRRLLEHLGGRLRWVETPSTPSDGTARALAAAGVTLEVDRSGTGATGPETHTVH